MTERRVFAALAACIMAFGSVLMIAPSVASAAEYQILYEDFDGGWEPGWYVTDHDSDSGSDYWGVTAYKSQSGAGSAWCAQIGFSSVNDLANSVNHFYDQDMQAVLQIVLPDLSGYENVTLEFYYWAETGTIALGDYAEVRAWNGEFWQHLWKQPEVDTDGLWDLVVLEIPLNTVWLSFSFVSDDSEIPGPFEGVYIDTVSVHAWDETPPTSAMADLDEYYSSETIYIIYAAMDYGGSGIEHVELYYRMHGVGNYEKYTTEDNVDGEWTAGVIPFNCSLADGYGGYDFYTLAEDLTGNREIPVVVPQTSTMIDVEAPTTTAVVVGGTLPEGWINSSVSIELDASDDLSGVAATRYRVDSGPWEDYDGAIDVTGEGEHVISYYSEDSAGNLEGAKSYGIAVDLTSPTAELASLEGITAFTDPTISFVWESEDGLSGIDYCLFKMDDRAFEFLGDSEGVVEAVNIDGGDHTATLRAYDRAGNYCEVTFAFEVELGEAGADSETEELIGWTVAIAVLIAAVIASLLLVWTYRRDAG